MSRMWVEADEHRFLTFELKKQTPRIAAAEFGFFCQAEHVVDSNATVSNTELGQYLLILLLVRSLLEFSV